MKKIFISIFIIALSFNFANAESKATKTDAEWIKEFQDLEKREKETDKKIEKSKEKTKALDKLEKTVDELSNKLGVDKK